MNITVEAVDEILSDDVEIQIDNQHCDFTIDKNKIIICNTGLKDGVHLLAIKQKSSNFLKISDVKINSCSVRDLLYLGYLIVDDTILQPATEFFCPGASWYLPFGNPISFWQSYAVKKIPPGNLGNNLFEQYKLFFPVPKNIPEYFPAVIKDFFLQDFDFTIIKKTDKLNYPITDINLLFDNREDIYHCVAQFDDHEIFRSLKQVGIANGENRLDDSQWVNSNWTLWNLFDYQTGWNITTDDFPALFEFIEKNQITEIASVSISSLAANSYIYPHIDAKYQEKFSGACQLYLPLNFKKGNFFKLGGAGTFEIDQQVKAFNVSRYAHSIINTTNSDRIALIIRCVIPSLLDQ
jgi:Aspartyl/Asparaginyl beta-hydroxylase